MRFLSILFLLCSFLSVQAQTSPTNPKIVCASANDFESTGGSSNRGVRWQVFRTKDGVMENSAVATLKRAGDNSALSFDVQEGNADNVLLNFSGKGNFRIHAIAKNKSGFFSSEKTFEFDFFVTVHIAQPEIEFVSLDGSNCSNPSVILKVKDPQVGMTYTWSPGGQTGTSVSTGAPAVTVTATSPSCPFLSPKGSLGFLPPFTSLGPGNFSVSGTFNPCIENPDDGFFFLFGGNINACSTFSWSGSGCAIVPGFENTSTTQVTFFGRGQFGSVSCTVTNFAGTSAQSSVTKTFNFTTLTDPNCRFLFKDPNDTGANALKAVVKDKQGNASIYPNPTNNVLNIANLSDAREVQVYSILGQMVYNQPVEAQQTTLQMDVSKLGNGSYVVVIVKNDGQRESKKLQIQK